MHEVLKRVEQFGVVPVIKIEDVKDAVPLAKALCEGGLPCAEVTFRTEAAEDAIRAMKEAYPDMLLIAGTVLTTEQADRAVAAGAQAVVSPGFNPKVVNYCVQKGILILPGCSCPSDMEQAIEAGLSVVKFFPAEASGGMKAIQAMAAPYGQLRFMPTGGINLSNMQEYLKNDRIVACGGSWMVPEKLIQAGEFEEIKRLTKEAVMAVHGFSLAHVGINSADEMEARKTANTFEHLFGFTANENPSSIFSASYVETIKKPYLGTKGHIAIAVNSVERAKAYLERIGAEFLEESAVYRPDGRLQAVYLREEIGGFAVHLVRRAA